jgi:hypothetical protein
MTIKRGRRRSPNQAGRKINRSEWQFRIDEISAASEERVKFLACHHVRVFALNDIDFSRSRLSKWAGEIADLNRGKATRSLYEIRLDMARAVQPRIFLSRLDPAIEAISKLAGGTLPNTLRRRARAIVNTVTKLDELHHEYLRRRRKAVEIDLRFVLRMLETNVDRLDKEARLFYEDARPLYDLPGIEPANIKQNSRLAG